MACSYRLLQYDNEKEFDKFKLWVKILGGGETDEPENADDLRELQTGPVRGQLTKETSVW